MEKNYIGVQEECMGVEEEFVQPAMYLKKFCITGCTTRNVFKKNFILRVVQPTM